MIFNILNSWWTCIFITTCTSDSFSFILWLAFCPFHPHEWECLLYKEPHTRLESLSMKGDEGFRFLVLDTPSFLFQYKIHQPLLAIYAQRNCIFVHWLSTIAHVLTASSHLLPLVVRHSLLSFNWSRDPM